MFMRIHLKSSNLCFRVFLDLVFLSLFIWINILFRFSHFVKICCYLLRPRPGGADLSLLERQPRPRKWSSTDFSSLMKIFSTFFFLFQVNVYIKNPVVTKIRRDQKIPVRHYKKWKLFFLLLANRWFGSSPIREAFLAFAWASAWSR